jgi:hypothetical protein
MGGNPRSVSQAATSITDEKALLDAAQCFAFHIS